MLQGGARALVAHRAHEETVLHAEALATLRQAREDCLHHRIEAQALLGVEVRRETHLGVHDVVARHVLEELVGHALERLRRLHHRDRVAKSFEV